MNQIMDKISKTLELGTNNSNANEAQNAILLAQKLMAKYHISQVDIENYINENEKKDDKVIEEKTENETNNDKWKRQLMLVIARNFRCDMYFKGQKIMLVGTSEDIQIVKRVYLYAKQAILEGFKKHLKSNSCYNYIDTSIRNKLKRDYAFGFISGLSEKFKEQNKNDELSMIIVNQNVKTYMKNLHLRGTRRSRSVNISSSISYVEGKRNGRNLADIDSSVKEEAK